MMISMDIKWVRVKQFIPFTRDKDRRVFWIGWKHCLIELVFRGIFWELVKKTNQCVPIFVCSFSTRWIKMIISVCSLESVQEQLTPSFSPNNVRNIARIVNPLPGESFCEFTIWMSRFKSVPISVSKSSPPCWCIVAKLGRPIFVWSQNFPLSLCHLASLARTVYGGGGAGVVTLGRGKVEVAPHCLIRFSKDFFYFLTECIMR